MTLIRLLRHTLLAASTAAVVLALSMNALRPSGLQEALAAYRLMGRAVLPAASFAPGPTSGALLSDQPINDHGVPFVNEQPVQGFSAILDNGDGTFLAMSDNGFGSLENSADFHLRVYTMRPKFIQLGQSGGINSGNIQIEGLVMTPTNISPSLSPITPLSNVFSPALILISNPCSACDGTLCIGVHLSRSPGQSWAGSSLDAKGPPWSTRPWTVSCRARADREHRRGQR
jgi:hypothetical protein